MMQIHPNERPCPPKAIQNIFVLPDHAAEIMCLFGFPDGADCADSLWWRSDGGVIKLFAQCSDLFMWATADVEPIEPEDMPLLRQSFADLQEVDATYWLAELFACRKRGHAPQKAFKPGDEQVQALFDSCGPKMVDPWE
jgi:hypothetical protein